MPNKHAAIKDLRKNVKRHAHNTKIRTNIKALTKQLTDLSKAGKHEEMKEIVKKLQQAVAKAAKVNVIHRNQSSRRISKAMKLANKK